MKKTFYIQTIKFSLAFTLFLFTFLSCKNEIKPSNITITKSKDTISVNEEITVKIHVNYYGSKQPLCQIITEHDTISIPFDEDIKCAIFKAITSKPLSKEFNYNGFVYYFDEKGKLNKENFSFSFYVK